MRAVIDTNVLVSALLKKGTPPAEVIADVLSGVLVVLYDQRILAEYREVLARPRLKLARQKVEALLEVIAADGIEVVDAEYDAELPDSDDQPFAAVAFTGGAEVLITGNTKDFPLAESVRVVTPRQWLDIRDRALEEPKGDREKSGEEGK